MHGQRIGYIRVSPLDQSSGRRLEGIPVSRVLTDRASGNDTQHPQLDALLGYLRESDTLMVHSMDHLARNLDDLRRLVQQLTIKRTESYLTEKLAELDCIIWLENVYR